jgi:hypothetical protein
VVRATMRPDDASVVFLWLENHSSQT